MGGAGSGEPVELACEVEVFGRQSGFGVGREHNGHLVPTDVDIRVVIGNLRGERNPDDEPDRLREVLEYERTGDRIALAFPRRVFAGELVELSRFKVCRHDPNLAPYPRTISRILGG